MLILEATDKGKVKAIKTCAHTFITHLFFADDVLVFGKDSMDEWICYKETISLFCKASCMLVSIRKSSFFHYKLEKHNLEGITFILPCKTFELENGFSIYIIFYNLMIPKYKICFGY